jgi:mannose-1-phosphate guanylyltransferase
MWELGEKDNNGNVISGDVLIRDVNDTLIRSEDRLIVGLGLENLVIIETLDAILVSCKDKTQEVKKIVENLESKNKTEANTHKTIYRPWGNYTSIANGINWQVKKIIVKEGQSLSLQLHKHRTEHWIVVKGKAHVEIDSKIKYLFENESIYIPLGSKHRLSNKEKEPLIIIEVQSGTYLGEDDIVRFKDNYGRN